MNWLLKSYYLGGSVVTELNCDLLASSLLVVLTPLTVVVIRLIDMRISTLHQDYTIRLIVENLDKLALLLLNNEVFQK